MKYIIGKNGSVCLFSETENHNDVAGFLAKNLSMKVSHYVKSAGFCNVIYAGDLHGMSIKAEAYGKSVSLDIESQQEDSGIITRFLNNNFND